MKVYLGKKQEKMLAKADKHFGQQKAKKISERLNDLHDAFSLLDIENLKYPGLHKLVGQREGQLALTTKQPFRLIIKPYNKEYDLNDLSTVTEVEVVELDINYHDK